MTNAKIKTVPTTADVADFLANLSDAQQQRDSQTLIDIMQHISDEPPVLWGPAIIGFGSYHYRYATGREGDMPRIAFSPRKGKLVLYVINYIDRYGTLLDQLGKHKTSKACLYITRLSDIDLAVLTKLIETAYQDLPT